MEVVVRMVGRQSPSNREWTPNASNPVSPRPRLRSNGTRGSTTPSRETDDRYWSAPEDSHYLILQVIIENTGEEAVDFQLGSLAVTADETAGEWTVLTDGSRMEATLEAGEELDGWIAYTIPTGTNEVVITADPEATVYATTFEKNTGLEIAMEPYQT